ncbi:MAG: AmpG family muropeptide MFS transporter, partial [Salinisphaera sp.]|nr:AmpG family muropeptide MFS transporter [Salinisphaera sp.]
MTGSSEPSGNAEQGWRTALAVYGRPRVIAMGFLGFSAGLPFLLVFSTLSAWLTQAGVTRTTIGFFSWVGITYSIKVFWAPVIDRLPLPVLTRLLGRRRGWMLLAQMGIAAGLVGMACCDPQAALLPMVGFAFLVAFSSATQDVSIDAWRIEAVPRSWQGS